MCNCTDIISQMISMFGHKIRVVLTLRLFGAVGPFIKDPSGHTVSRFNIAYVEIEIMFCIPEIFKKVLLLCYSRLFLRKSFCNDFFLFLLHVLLSWWSILLKI